MVTLGKVYDLSEIERSMTVPGSPSGGSQSGARKYVWTLPDEALQDLVDLIPNPSDINRDVWIAVMHGIMGAGGTFETFDGWSAKWPGDGKGDSYDPAKTQSRWDTVNPANVRSGGGLLRQIAEEMNPEGFAGWRKKWELPGAFSDEEFPVEEAGAEMVEAMQRTVANAIVKRYGDRIRWNVSTSMWHSFSGIWRESPHPLGYRLAKQWADAAAPTLGKAALAAVSKSGFYEGVEKILRADPALAVVKTDFDTDNWLLGTPGGTVDLRTGFLRASVASEMISLSCGVAPAATEACPKWLAFVKWACTDPKEKDPFKAVDMGMMKTLQQWAGYCLTGDVSQEMVMFFHGGGANGKGTFVETLQAVLGDYFHLAAKDLFMATKWGVHTEDMAALAGKRMVVADEVPTSAQWNESLLKSVSGGGMLPARHLYGKSFTFPIRFKVTIIGNEKPTFQGAINAALKRRLRLAEFLNEAKPQSNTLKRELVAEAPGVLRWMINGLSDMLAGPGGALFVADSMVAATDEYFKDSDLFRQWLDENVEATPGKNAPAGALFEDWEGWRNKQGNHTLIGSHKKFKEEMLKRGKTWKMTKTGNVYNDLSIKAF